MLSTLRPDQPMGTTAPHTARCCRWSWYCITGAAGLIYATLDALRSATRRPARQHVAPRYV